ncbi:MAG: hypothetical protein ACI9DH_001823 [Halioglobus sp.]|jgi:hypothetical protein
MLHLNLMFGTLIIVLCVAFHVAGLAYATPILRTIAGAGNHPNRRHRVLLVMIIAVLVVIALHTVEIWAWAAVYWYIGEFQDFEAALYFSAVTATTVGYGDLTLSPQWRILGPFEAMGGLILFGASTAYLLQLMRGLFDAFSTDDN